MNKGIEILLARMDSNPEEFQDGWGDYNTPIERSRWSTFLNIIYQRYERDSPSVPEVAFLTDEEVNMVIIKHLSIQADSFTDAVMRELLRDTENRVEEVQWAKGTVKAVGGGTGATMQSHMAKVMAQQATAQQALAQALYDKEVKERALKARGEPGILGNILSKVFP